MPDDDKSWEENPEEIQDEDDDDESEGGEVPPWMWGGRENGGGGGGDGNGGGDWGIGPGGENGGNGKNDGTWDKKKKSTSWLKISKKGFLMMDKNKILYGSLVCPLAPPVLISVVDDENGKHKPCLFCKIEPDDRNFKKVNDPKFPTLETDKKEETEDSEKPENIEEKRDFLLKFIACYFDLNPGSFVLKARWQKGHYSYDKISKANIMVFGVLKSAVTLPLSDWIEVANITISENLEITVDGSVGSINGNAIYLTDEKTEVENAEN